MDPLLIGFSLVFFLFLYLSLGVWIFASMMLVTFTSLTLVLGYPLTHVGAVLKGIFWNTSTTWELAALPLFIWMGEIVFRTDMSDRLFQGLTPIVDRIPGRLLHTNVIGCTIFAAVCGSSTATTATIGKITLKALSDRKYDTDLTIGSLAGAGSLGLMIPPSIIMIVYGILAEVSIARLFAAGFLPGFLLAGLYTVYIIVRCAINPNLTPLRGAAYGLRDIVRGIGRMMPVMLLVVIVLGGIYSGLVTPSESAAVGVFGALFISLLTRQLRWSLVLESLRGTIRVNAMICAIVLGAALLSATMGLLHTASDIADVIARFRFSPYQLIFVLSVFYLVLGCFLDGISIIMMTLPVVTPLVTSAGFDLVWFGVFLVVVVELAQITPPVGFNLFVIQGIAGFPIGRIARASFPFFLLMCTGAVILVLFPDIALWLPGVLFGYN